LGLLLCHSQTFLPSETLLLEDFYIPMVFHGIIPQFPPKGSWPIKANWQLPWNFGFTGISIRLGGNYLMGIISSP